MTIGEMRRLIRGRLQDAGIESAEYETRVLMETALGIRREEYLLDAGKECSPEKEASLFDMVSKREARIPLQQILGEASFMGYTFHIDEHVLVPRMDTECLVEQAVRIIREELSGRQRIRVLDLCTGSGCIGISTKLLCPHVEMELSDVSGPALEVAQRNAESLKADVGIIRGDLLENVRGPYDMILSNPPYIPSDDIQGLMPEVRDHEPRIALDGDRDGLLYYRRIIREGASYLNPGGFILFEIGAWQGEEVSDILRQSGFGGIRIHRDPAGLNRVVEAIRPASRDNDMGNGGYENV